MTFCPTASKTSFRGRHLLFILFFLLLCLSVALPCYLFFVGSLLLSLSHSLLIPISHSVSLLLPSFPEGCRNAASSCVPSTLHPSHFLLLAAFFLHLMHQRTSCCKRNRTLKQRFQMRTCMCLTRWPYDGSLSLSLVLLLLLVQSKHVSFLLPFNKRPRIHVDSFFGGIFVSSPADTSTKRITFDPSSQIATVIDSKMDIHLLSISKWTEHWRSFHRPKPAKSFLHSPFLFSPSLSLSLSLSVMRV